MTSNDWFPNGLAALAMNETFPLIKARMNWDGQKEQGSLPVYHYTDFAGLSGIVGSQCVWATNAAYLNDAMEFTYARDLAVDALTKLAEKTNRSIATRLRSCFSEGIAHAPKQELYVCSFSAKRDCLSQWRGYGAQIGGYALGFRSADIVAIAERERREDKYRTSWAAVARCIYDTEEQRLIISEWFEEILSYIDGLEDNPLVDEDYGWIARSMLHLVAPFFKDPAFEEEAEWRLVIAPIVDPKNVDYWKVFVRPGQVMAIPYLQVPLIVPFQFTEVIVGPTPVPCELAERSITHLFRGQDQLVSTLNITSTSCPFRPT